MQRAGYLPDADRVSVFAAAILLAYTLMRFIEIPAQEPGIQLPGIFISIPINLQTLVTILVSGLTAAGSDWVVRGHPGLQGKSATRHTFLPALAALVVAIPLNQVQASEIWWLGLFVGGALIVFVLVAEYVIVDREDMRYPAAASALTAVSFTIFFILVVSLQTAGWRLYGLLPILALSSGLVSLRALYLRTQHELPLLEALVVGVVVAQLGAALHYWPLSPIGFGLALLGPAYALTSWIGGLAEEKTPREALPEPLIALAICWGAAWVVG